MDYKNFQSYSSSALLYDFVVQNPGTLELEEPDQYLRLHIPGVSARDRKIL